eukprot:CAMPEP_0194135964 /NCGR_PEP_ID=MMETSP0152-20130528/6020_1 /TAXON_ID=1049557 /ORGANISM="Thalassiothrix antarctica, Strain L6-D1" /LENGTH=722 /DNA_ID=CAMNT_0038832429 /DNA_START=67 /DNA_END=2235 /DNA_ORIENTATION=+
MARRKVMGIGGVKESTLHQSLLQNEEDGGETETTSSLSSLSPLSPDTLLYHSTAESYRDFNNKSQPSPPKHLLATINRPLFPKGEKRTAEVISPFHSFDSIEPTTRTQQEENQPMKIEYEKTEASTPKVGTKSTTNTFKPQYYSTIILQRVSQKFMKHYSDHEQSTWIGFWALFSITCANYVLTPMRDAVALSVGVSNLPKLTLLSTVLAFVSSVPIGWLFEAPDPQRRKLWKRMGLTRGETQGTSLALFYRAFIISILSYAMGFLIFRPSEEAEEKELEGKILSISSIWSLLQQLGQLTYIAFFLVVHLMKLHSLSLIWGVATEAMEYEDVARKRLNIPNTLPRLRRLAFIGFGGTLGGILGSFLALSMAHILRLSGLLVVAAVLLEIGAELSIELGRIMRIHWKEQQGIISKSSEDLSSLDKSLTRSNSMGSMKRVASGNSLHRCRSMSELADEQNQKKPQNNGNGLNFNITKEEPVDDNTFTQRLLRGITTILRSRLLMSIFTYNALYASTTVLLSFQRAALVVARNKTSTTESNTAFLANINMASSLVVFALQASGAGAYVAQKVGTRGTLSLMPLIRLMGVLGLAWWHSSSGGKPPNLVLFLLLDECTRVMNLAVAKPVRESLWRGLSNEARYEAKPIVDTLANRWGGGSAAFLVSFTDKMLDLFGIGIKLEDGTRTILGYPPILFLCMIIAAWWTMISADLGQIRRRIDMELKKRQ